MRKSVIFIALTLMVASSVDALILSELMNHKPYFARITFRQVEGNPAVVLNKAGAIVSSRFVLTTAFYIANSFDFQIFVGSAFRDHQTQLRGIQLIGLSDRPDGPALIQTEFPIPFSPNIQPIRMVPADRSIGMPNEEGMVLGMLPAAGERLRAVFMRSISSANCAAYYPGRNVDEVFCAMDSTRGDFCNDDRGTAFTVLSRGEEMLAGIALEGVCNPVPAPRPSLFVSVAFFRDRINDILEGRQVGSSN